MPVSDVELKVPFHLVLSVLAAGMVVAIFLFRNRPRQMRFVRGTYLLLLAVIAFQFIVDRSVTGYLAQGGTVKTQYGITFVLPIAALVLAFLAERAIRADEELVRSMDRLR
jgi:peptidoglycan/LPS O-acetylase OafA/YrhL